MGKPGNKWFSSMQFMVTGLKSHIFMGPWFITLLELSSKYRNLRLFVINYQFLSFFRVKTHVFASFD